MGYSRQERLALCALFDETGPDAPTLCAGWTTADLAAHLVLRERRPDAAAGMLGGPLAGHTARTQRRLRDRSTFPELVQTIRTGPPRLSMMGLPGMDERLNTVEYFVHHEDVRRAAGGWQARELDDAESDELWRRLGVARALLRKAPVGVELARDDTEPGNGTKLRITAKKTTPMVTVIGAPAELTMWATGRAEAANVRFDGTEAAMALLAGSKWGLGA
ncbi:MAG TPA: TIGR03085 family metal-binding protein [Streptosporangiaceae bacterium]